MYIYMYIHIIYIYIIDEIGIEVINSKNEKGSTVDSKINFLLSYYIVDLFELKFVS